MKPENTIGAVLVIGGGIGGIQSALTLAETGYKVYIVEKSPAIGGTMAQLDKTFPTNDCAMCILSPKLVECGRHLNVEILTYSEVTGVEGEPGNFEVTIKKHPRYIDLEKCTGCGDCAQVCPVELPSEFDQGLGLRKAIYRPFAQAFPGAFAIDKRGKPPCRLTCPARVDVQGYVALISKGKYAEALALIKERLPLPGVLGRICTHPCEAECNRKSFDGSVSICALKRFVADSVSEEIETPPSEPKNERVAIIGSGPAGLSAAYFLAKDGYKTTIFEGLPVSGGMLAVGIPEYRLPRNVLAREVESIKRLGVEIKSGIMVGRDLSINDLFKQGYSAVFIATGAHGNQKLGIPGEVAEGVIPGVTFLKKLNLEKTVKIGERVAVIGGGNVAIDSARSALRLGAKDVSVFYRRTRAEMPASPEEIEAAESEGIKIRYLVNPTEILTQNSKVSGIKCIHMRLGNPDDSGRKRPIPVKGSDFNIPIDTVIPAIGQTADLSFVTGGSGLEIDQRGILKINQKTLATTREGVFAGGDLQTGPATAIEAVAAGRRAAFSIASYIRGEEIETGIEEEKEKPVDLSQVPSPSQKRQRNELPALSFKERIGNFKEVNIGFSEETAVAEAKRCLNCGVCSECMQCVTACKAQAVDHTMTEETLKLQVGAIILSPGFEKFNPSSIRDYGYGIYSNVVTSAEFERILSASGPYQGQLVRPSDRKPPRRIAWLQCVGSRDVSVGHEYCSSVCCTYAIKEAVIAKEHASQDLEVTIFFMDIRTFGKGFDDYYQRAKEEYGVRFVKTKVHSIKPSATTENLILRYATEKGNLVKEEFDIVVLSIGFQPSSQMIDLAKKLGVDVNKYGFCQTGEWSLTETSKPGIFVAGAFQGPKDIPETVVQATAAAAGSAGLLSTARNTVARDKEYPPEIEVAEEPPRIGVFICHCGLNIGGTINVPQVREYISGLPYVVFADDNMYTCSQDTQNKIKAKIQEYKLNRIVVASCSPRTHEPLFQETIREAGLNRFLFEMANIRDQCSWVHQHEPDKATQKAKELIRMAVSRAALLEPLHKVKLGLKPEALVIGGGVAGMTASISLAQQGFKTYLIEREKELGGWARKIRWTPEGKDVQSFVRDLISEVSSNGLIEVLTGTSLLKTEGFVGNFKTTLKLEDGNKQRLIEHGAIIVATGTTEYRGSEYLLGQDERIITLSDFEQELFQNSDKLTQSKEIVITLCVRPPALNYCSRTCCTSAIKNALKLRQINPRANIYILYKDIRTYGFKEELYTRARDEGILFIRYTDERPPQVGIADHMIRIDILDPILDEELTLLPDLLVLATPMVPAAGNNDLSGILKVPLTKEGFFHEAHAKLAPVDFASEGIFMCGTAHSPKFLDETIAQALASAGRAATILSKKQLEVGGSISQVDANKCKACLTCIRVCPYDVPRINAEGVAEIDVAKCRGCGICAAECPRKAIKLMHYKEAQVVAKTDALLTVAI